MNDRLAPLLLLPPPFNTPWTGMTDQTLESIVSCRDGNRHTFTSPLFWHDPNWCEMPTEQADTLAVAIANLNTLVAAMRSELAPPDRCSVFHGGRSDDASDEGEGNTEEAPPQDPLPRIVPYRPERYGMSAQDFDDATIIDVRLMMARDASGRFAFSPDQIRRWEATPSDEPLAGGGWVPAATFPPDVISIKHVARKLDQLRVLAPGAGIFVTIQPYRLDEDLSRILATGPDGVILRIDDMHLDGLSFAKLVQRARQEMNEAGASEMPLWVAPGEVSADDVVKLIELGATAVAIDSWCEALIEEAESATSGGTTSGFGGSTRSTPIDPNYLRELAEYRIGPLISRVMGLGFSIGRVSKSDRLGSFDPKWSADLGVKELG